MKVGVPRERKTLEKRVGLSPDGAAQLTKKGHTVLIETGAGDGSLFSDGEYMSVGCQIVPTLADVWSKSDLVVKVKEPHESEYQYQRKGLLLFDYLHLASMPEVAQALLKGGTTSIAYELVQTADGRLPLLEPMSEVAGKLSVQVGAHYLLNHQGGRGVLLGGTIGVPPRYVTVIGAGVSGRAACEIALGMGARVAVLDISMQKLEHVKNIFQGRVRTIFSTPASLARECARSDLLIGAVLIPGAKAPHLITREMIKAMKPGSVFVDISIDQGGCAETSRPTSLDKPVYTEEGVIHYGVCNMPAQVARTSTMALTSVTLPYILALAEHGVKSFDIMPELKAALNTHNGLLTNRAVGEALGVDYTTIAKALM